MHTDNKNLNIIFITACLFATLPVLIPTYPPMVDAPQHVAQIASFTSILSGTNPFSELFDIQWFTPYLLGYSVVFTLSTVLGYVWAFKLTTAVAIFLFPIFADKFLRSQKITSPLRWLLIPLPYGFAYEWGFFNFLIAMPLGFLFLSYIPTERSTYTRKDYFKIAFWVHLLFAAHILVLLVFASIAAFLLYTKNLKSWLHRLLPYFTVVPAISIWFTLKILNGNGTDATSGPWGLGLHRLTDFLPTLFSLPNLTTSQYIAAILCCTPFFLGMKLEISVRKIAPFLLYSIIMLFGPNYLFGTFFVYNRFGFIGLPLYFHMFIWREAPPHEKAATYTSPLLILFSVLLIAYHTGKAFTYEKESAGFREILNYMQPDKRVLSLAFNRNSALYDAPVYLHYPVWYQASKGGLVDFNFAYFFPQVVRFKPENIPPANDGFVWYPHTFEWNRLKASQYDYFLIKYNADISNEIFPENSVFLIRNIGDWYLYERL